MKWVRAVHHVELAAESCAKAADLPQSLTSLRVTQLWAVGDILGPEQDLDSVTVVLGIDEPAADVPWWGIPHAGDHWLALTRLVKNPVLCWWRSTQAPIWNHRIVAPLLVWTAADGLDEAALQALREGRGKAAGQPEPAAAEFRRRMADELAISQAALDRCTTTYDERRWGQGKLEPVADALWRASSGYLDVLAGQPEG